MFQASDAIKLETGVYEATLTEVAVKQPNEDSQFQEPFVRWSFLAEADEYPEGVPLTGASSLRFGPKSKARKWMQALLGRSFQAGEMVDPNEYCPLPCQIVVELDPDKDFSRIKDVLPPKKGKKKAATTPADDGIDL